MKSTIKLAFTCTPAQAIELGKKFSNTFDLTHTEHYSFHKGENWVDINDDNKITHCSPFILIDLYERSEIDNIVNKRDYKYAELSVLSEVLDLNISIDKETCLGESKGIKFCLIQHEIAEDAVSECISHWGWQHTIKPWENESDLLKRIPSALQNEAFCNILTNMTYIDVEEVLVANENNSIEWFNLLATNAFIDEGYQEFMEYMVAKNTYSKAAVRSYLQSRYNIGVQLNSIFAHEEIEDYDQLYPKGV